MHFKYHICDLKLKKMWIVEWVWVEISKLFFNNINLTWNLPAYKRLTDTLYHIYILDLCRVS